MARSKSDATKPVDMLDELAEQFSARYNPHSRRTMLVKKHSSTKHSFPSLLQHKKLRALAVVIVTFRDISEISVQSILRVLLSILRVLLSILSAAAEYTFSVGRC